MSITDDVHTSDTRLSLHDVHYDSKTKTYTFKLGIDDYQQRILVINANTVKWSGSIYHYSEDVRFELTLIRAEKPFEYYCNEAAVAGRYRDKQGRLYTFTDSGIAQWPNDTFNYQTCIDYYGLSMDCIVRYSVFDSVRQGCVTYGYKRSGRKMHLYMDSTDGEWTYFRENPFLVIGEEAQR